MALLIGIIFQLLFAVFFLFLCLSFITGAPFVPSTGKTSRRMIELGEISQSDVIYDLGSGDGRLLFMAAKKGAKKVVGLEINPMLVLFTNIRKLFTPYRTVIGCYWKNYWVTPLHDADVVFVYLLPWKMEKLAHKLQKELKPGTRIVSNSFIFPHWPMITADETHHVYVFKIPKKG